MHKADPNLAVYQSLTRLAGQMVDAARSSDWDSLVALEQNCAGLIASLRLPDEAAQADPANAGQKVALIRAALAHDAQVREITEAWMARLQACMGDARRTTRLQQAYLGDGA